MGADDDSDGEHDENNELPLDNNDHGIIDISAIDEV